VLTFKVPLLSQYARGIGLTRQVLAAEYGAAKPPNLPENSLVSQLLACFSAWSGIVGLPADLRGPLGGLVSKALVLADNPMVNFR
jgi:hypothetical protein